MNTIGHLLLCLVATCAVGLVGQTIATGQTAPAPTAAATPAATLADPLPSWNDGARKRAILDFVAKVTKEGGPDFVPVAERIAVFDNDGTLWAEQPMYFQFLFAVDRIRALAPQHPEWKTTEPFASVLRGDIHAALAGGEHAILKHIGRRPIAAFGNSDGDLAMLQWTAAGRGPSLCIYVHHTDAQREWAYDRQSKVGRLDKGIDEATAKGWTVVDMKNDWKTIYPPAAR